MTEARSDESSPADDRRAEVVAALEERETNLLALYEAAIDTLAAEGIGGREAIRVLVICHCMRELMNGLPAVMSDSAGKRPKPSSSTLAQKLPALRAKHAELDLELDQDLIPIPREAALEFNALIRAATQEEGWNRRNRAALLTGGTYEAHPAIKQWSATSRFFTKWSHLDQHDEHDGALPSDDVLRTHIQVVEDVIAVRSGLFFDNLRAVADLLADANAVDDGGEQ